MRSLLISLFAFLFFAPSAFAITQGKAITEPTRTENRQELRDGEGSGKSVAANHANRLEKRFEFYFGRFTNIIKRLESRLAILVAEGKDTTEIENSLKLAKDSLSQAKKSGDNAIASFRSIEDGQFPNQRTQAFAARDQAVEARRLFQTVQTELHNIVLAMQELVAN